MNQYNRINIFLPTYKRVESGMLPRFVDSLVKCADCLDNLYITFLINADDVDTVYYLKSAVIPIEYQALYWNEDKPHLGRMYNYLYENTKVKDRSVISMVGDDMEVQTPGYDTAILNAINRHGGKVVVYCNDLFQREKLCVNLFTTRELVGLTGKPFMCEKFASYYIDTVWMYVVKELRLGAYLKDVVIKHHHASLTVHQDETHQGLKAQQVTFKTGYAEAKKYASEIIKHLQGKL
jgi:hypothetical protein